MPTPSEQLLSRTIYDIDGVTTVWDFSFSGGYLDPTHVKAYTELPTGVRTPVVITPEMLIGEFQLHISPALPPSAGVLVIYRDTPKDLPLVDFVEGPLSEIALDTNAKQAVFIAAEAQDTINTSNLQAAIDAQVAAQVAAEQADIDASTAASAATAAVTTVAALAGPTGSALMGFQQAGGVARTVEDKLRESVSVFDFMTEAQITDAQSGAATLDSTTAIGQAGSAAATTPEREVVFPSGRYNFSFQKPPYGVTWVFKGTDISRQAIGGLSNDVRFMRPKLTYVDGPHVNSQVHVEHDRVIAKGSNAIGAQYADYAYGNTIEKEHWSETTGTPVAGEINNITLFHRNGCVTGDPVKTGGAGILANLGQTAGSGYTQLLEAVNSVFTKATLAVQKQINMQLLGIDEKTNESYGIVLNSVTGNQQTAIRVRGETNSTWGRIIDGYISAVNNFFIDVAGKIRWRNNGASMSLEQDNTTHAVVFRNETGVAMMYATPNGGAVRAATNVQTGTTYTINAAEIAGDMGKLVILANASPITVTLPNNAPAGFAFEALQRDPGQVTFVAASGATLQNVDGHTKIKGQFGVVRLRVRLNSSGAAAVWIMDGATAA